METVPSDKLSKVVREIKNAAYEEKQEIRSEEEIINTFLDSINEFKSGLVKTVKKIEPLVDKIEELSWILENPTQDDLSELNQLIVLSEDLKKSMIIKYVSFNYLRSRGIAKDEISTFKSTIDSFTEAYKDLQSTFFTLPKRDDFSGYNSSPFIMIVYCTDDFKSIIESYRRKPSYNDIDELVIEYIFDNDFDSLKSGVNLNKSNKIPFIKKRLGGRGGFRIYQLLKVESQEVYLLYVYPKAGPYGTSNFTDDGKTEIYKEGLSCLEGSSMKYIVEVNADRTLLIFKTVD